MLGGQHTQAHELASLVSYTPQQAAVVLDLPIWRLGVNPAHAGMVWACNHARQGGISCSQCAGLSVTYMKEQYAVPAWQAGGS